MFSSNTTQTSGGYEIQRSLRFNSADSAYLNRTQTTGNFRSWSLSAWVKRSALGTEQHLLGNFSYAGAGLQFYFTSGNTLKYVDGNSVSLETTQVFRDASAFYHFVLVYDSTNATSTDRVRIYVNGVRITAFSSTSYPALNNESNLNYTSSTVYLGEYFGGGPYYFNGYMTEINLIDGQALTPSSFGEYNADTGVWQPKRYAGSYGTNGFYLNFSDNSNTTAATLGADYSGNGNNWTPNNFSVSAGAGNDSLVDSPTSYGTDTGVGGTVRGNYCTLNPLSTTSGTYTQGNLRYVGPNTGSYVRSNGTLALTTGKWYWEVTLANAPFSPRDGSSAYNAFGFGVSTTFNSTTSLNSITDAVILQDSGFYKNFSGSVTDGGTAFSSGDVLAVAVDLDANTFTFYRNNTQIATGTIGGTAGRELVPIIISYSSAYGVMDCNFGQRPFAYTAPSGFKALNTQNLPTPTIGATTATQAGKFFNPVLWAGTGTQTRSITGLDFQPDFTWMKSRSIPQEHQLYDVVRGAGGGKMLCSNRTSVEGDDSFGNSDSQYGFLSSFDANGFSVDDGSVATTGGWVNEVGRTYVAWNWKANGAGVTNTAGSITSTVSANTTSGFSVVTYTGNGTAGATIGHGLGATPKMVIVKGRTGSLFWTVYHASARASGVGPESTYMILNATDAAINNSTPWNSTLPTSSVFSVGTASVTNNSATPFVAYCFAEVPGYSKFGSYVGTGSSDGAFVFCGFRPAYLMVKRTDTANDWYIIDAVRDGYNVIGPELFANRSDAEALGSTRADFLSNGFKLRSSGAGWNASGGTYIFMAFAEAPQKFALAR